MIVIEQEWSAFAAINAAIVEIERCPRRLALEMLAVGVELSLMHLSRRPMQSSRLNRLMAMSARMGLGSATFF